MKIRCVIKIQTIYVKVRHWLFWYGVYGFCNKSCNDEITLYSDIGQKKFLGYFELTTKQSLEYLLKNDMDIIGDEKDYCDEIEEFINGKQDIHYFYIYPRDSEEDSLSRQVSHFAPTNRDGYKPVYIDMWTKLSKSWDIDEIKKSVRMLAKDFLHLDIEKVELIDIPTYEETKLSYEQDYSLT